MRALALPLATLVVASCVAGARADDAPGYVPGPWHFRSVACVDTTVKSVVPRLSDGGHGPYAAADFTASGVAVTFATSLGLAPVFRHESAAIVHYQGVTGNAEMVAEQPGNRVQVCFLGGPAPTIGCNPDTDVRGRQYRVWDYERKAQYAGFNAEHLCGGA